MIGQSSLRENCITGGLQKFCVSEQEGAFLCAVTVTAENTQ